MVSVMLKRATRLTTALAIVLPAPFASADFLKDAKGSLELRNFYYNRDFRNNGAIQSKRDEWGQGFILNLQSGFTEGKVGFGVDAQGQLGFVVGQV